MLSEDRIRKVDGGKVLVSGNLTEKITKITLFVLLKTGQSFINLDDAFAEC